MDNNHSALGYACGLLSDGDYTRNVYPDIVQILNVECRYDPGIIIQDQSVCKHACEVNDLQLVQALTVCKVDISDSTGSTLLHYACQSGCTDIVQYLLKRECDQTAVDISGELALHVACHTSLEIVRMLDKYGINTQNADGNAPLHIACEAMKEDVVS